MALGTGERRQRAKLHDTFPERVVLSGDLYLCGHPCLGLGFHRTAGPRRLLDQAPQQRADLRRGQMVIDLDILERGARHRLEARLARLLHDRGPAASLDAPEPGCAVVEGAG